ncbi:hypothetical protein VOLCADRAFT_88147 [Volvox carteri f. nagariensis]|uniref:Fe2OG dioxygenase domain-containing protein n=1 Tax=Volvox carteri f. nagariensis TaxID=3068 RepID=D8TNE5_VOLCA|nr:uncharacterized protein VOLCADRAFT_88147 [Volvox carteri f. nagariensis]EFJ50827.1 hypothetical protein VOLCADRAFT_88147 [Volvox carteri f. nagariensis]|eukprot:XP_002947839.1 hypothetical protein VOLCADRAFT_88147 [Volvox carteri f. nagariensis]
MWRLFRRGARRKQQEQEQLLREQIRQQLEQQQQQLSRQQRKLPDEVGPQQQQQQEPQRHEVQADQAPELLSQPQPQQRGTDLLLSAFSPGRRVAPAPQPRSPETPSAVVIDRSAALPAAAQVAAEWLPQGPTSPMASPAPKPPLATPAEAATAPPPSPEDIITIDQRPSAHAATAAGGGVAPPKAPTQPPQPQPHSRRGTRGDVRRGTAAAAIAAGETPFLEPPLLQHPLLLPPGDGGGGGVAGHRGASRASSITGTAAGVPYSGKVDLEVDVAVVGAGVTGLATALALRRVYPRLRIKVFDRRSARPEGSRKYGSYCRLEPNGLRAAAAIDPRLRTAILQHGLRARPVLIHDTDGSLITRLEEGGTRSMRRFGEPYITIGWYELEQALLSLLPPDIVQYGAHYVGHRERDDGAYISFRRSAPALVRAGFLVACDGPFSDVRKRMVRDGDPMYDGVVKWLGRLPGDDVPSLPLDFNAVWLSPGRTFLSHSLAGGDVAWEAVATDPDLRELGFRRVGYNLITKRVERLPQGAPRTASLRSSSVRHPSSGFLPAIAGLPSGNKPSAAGRRTLYTSLEDDARQQFSGSGTTRHHGTATDAVTATQAPAAPDSATGELPFDAVSAAAAAASLPAADVSYLDSDELRSDDEAADGEGYGEASEGEEGEEDARGSGEVLQKLLALFTDFPPEVRAMLRNTRPSAVVEAGVWVRRASELPSALGRGRVLILGEAAHPMRPSSQEENQALEDAAVLGGCVQLHGLNKEALRRYEAERKPRWRHVMQLAMAANSTPSATSSGLSQALLDYNTALHGATFRRLHAPLGWRLVEAAKRALWVTALAGACGGLWVGAAALLRSSGLEHLGPFTAAAAVLDDIRRRVAAAGARASRVAAETGSVTAGVAAANQEVRGEKESGGLPAAAAAAAAGERRPWWRRRPWAQRRPRVAKVQTVEEKDAESAPAAMEAAAEERQRRPWRVDKLLRGRDAPAAVAQAAAVVAAPAVVAVGGVSDAVVRAKDYVVEKGFAVVDGVFGRDVARQLRAEVLQLYEQGLMHKNCTHLVVSNCGASPKHPPTAHPSSPLLATPIPPNPNRNPNRNRNRNPNPPRGQAAAPLCASLNSDRTLATLLSLFLPQLTLDAQAIKLQYNAGGGGCFPMHYDSDELLDGRRVTAIFYLNPGWTESHGGQLRLYPFPRAPLDLEPLEDRLVLFASTRMLHRVLPSTAASRCCFTIWMSQSRKRSFVRHTPSLSSLEPPGSPSDDPAAAARFLMHPSVRQHVCKLVYASEWARSLEESHMVSEAREAMLEQHHREVAIIRRSLGKYLPVVEQLARGELSANMEWF